jgi:hypothetical protein
LQQEEEARLVQMLVQPVLALRLEQVQELGPVLVLEQVLALERVQQR